LSEGGTLPSANEMDNLDPIIISNNRRVPRLPSYYLAVQFDRDPLRRQ